MNADPEAWMQAEYYVLGVLLNQPSLGLNLELDPAYFTQDNTRLIYAAIQKLQAQSEPIDVLTVSDRLERETGRPWLEHVGKIARGQQLSANVKAYAGLLRDGYRKRRV